MQHFEHLIVTESDAVIECPNVHMALFKGYRAEFLYGACRRNAVFQSRGQQSLDLIKGVLR